MSDTRPVISVIVPVYNGESFLAEALESIAAQAYAPLQVLVVDDGSTDESAAVAARCAGITVLQQPHRGLNSALNHGLHCAVGDFITFLDADDRWLPGKLARQLAALQQNPAADMVFGQARQFTGQQTADDPTVVYTDPQPAYSKITLMARHTVFQQIGGFDESGLTHDFLDWFARARQAGLQTLLLPDLLAERRIHATNYGRTNQAELQRSYLHTLRAVVQQRRQSTETPTND